jgi:signal transduction histidine kinase
LSVATTAERSGYFGSPLWWRLPSWAALIAVAVVAADGLAAKIATGAVMAAGAGLFQLISHPQVGARRVAVLGATAGGIAATLLAPNGVGEVLLLVAASRVTNAFDGVVLRWFTVLDAVAFGVTIAVISHSLAGLLAGIGVPLLVQRNIEHRDLVRERDRATALLAEVQRGRESEAQAAALQERGRIAREMHDVLAHSLAGLSVQLQAIRAVAARENVSRTVLDPIDKAAQLARDGLAEARAAVSTLRDPVGLGVDALPALVERHPGQARLDVTGDPGSVSPDAGHAVYRAVQESLTNAARYAPGSAVTVGLVWSATALTVTVDDTGRAPDRSAVAGPGTGLGLAGMDDRVRQAAGTLHAGPRPDGGWQVEIRVPVSVNAAVGR